MAISTPTLEWNQFPIESMPNPEIEWRAVSLDQHQFVHIAREHEDWPDDSLRSESSRWPVIQSPRYILSTQDLEHIIEEQRKIIQHCLSILDSVKDTLADTQTCYSTSITSVTWNDTELPLRLPLTAIIQHDEDEVVARLPEFSASGFGNTESEAVDDLKSELGSLYKELTEIPEDELGALPIRWKRGLGHLVMSNA